MVGGIMEQEKVERHAYFRKKVYQAYQEVIRSGVYVNSRYSIPFTFHSGAKKVSRSIDPMVSSAIANCLMPKSCSMYRGGHGGGKTSLCQKVAHVMTSIPEDDIARAMIRGNDDETVRSLVASLKLGKLINSGEEEVDWRPFLTSPVKIIDEVNRFLPSTLNGLFEVLNKGSTGAFGEYYEGGDYVCYATENPHDEGTYPMSKPFLDRFGMCINAPQVPSPNDLFVLSQRRDDKLNKIVIEPVLTFDELKEIRRMISEDITFTSEALLYTVYFVSGLSLCIRGDQNDKGQSTIPVGPRCEGCDFKEQYCEMTQQGISGRAFLDILRIGKAYSWFLGAFADPAKPEVQMSVIQSILPYVINHRVKSNEHMLRKDPYWGREFNFSEDLVARVTSQFSTSKALLADLNDLLSGNIALEDSKLNDPIKDLVITYGYKPLVQEASSSQKFKSLYKILNERQLTIGDIQKVERGIFEADEILPQARMYLIQLLNIQKSTIAEIGGVPA